MKENRCCPADYAMKMVWEKELQYESNYLENSNIDELSKIFKVLSHPLRLKIVLLLLRGDHCVCELVSVLKEKQNLISYNLGILKENNIINSNYRSKFKYYRLNETAIPIIRCIKENLIDKSSFR